MTKTKKALLAAIACSAALAGAIGFAACNNGDDGHEHIWNSDYTIDTPATCTTDGSKSIHCSGCDETKDIEVIPAGHSWDEDFTIDTPAGCTTDGSKSKHCSGCDATTEVTTIPAGHSWDEDFTIDLEPTCTAEGSKSKHCTVDGCDATSEVTAIPANGHDWDEWEIITMPTTEEDGTGIATKTCKVDGCEGLLQVILPNLLSEDYVKGEDSATCSAAGEQSYTYTDSDDNTVTFNVETPRKEFTLTKVTAGLTGSISLPSGGTISLTTVSHCKCDECGKTFHSNGTLTDEARHTEENEITILTKASSNINVGTSTAFNGPVQLGDNKIYLTNKGGVLFKAEEDGVYKFSSEVATALYGIAYFGNTESGTTPSAVYKSGNTLDDTAKQYSRFNYTSFTDTTVYVRMNEGDVVGVAYNATVKAIDVNVEKVTDTSTLNCYMHSEEYDVSGFDVNGGTFKYQCALCGKEADDLDSKQPIVYTSGTVVNEANENSPVALTEDILVVKTGVATGTYYSFTPNAAKDYEITFDTVLAGNTLTLKGIKCGDDTVATYDTALTVNSAFRSIIYIERSATGTIVTLKISADNVGKPFTFNFDVAGASADSPAYLTSAVKSDLPKFIGEGESTVNIAEAYEFSDYYYFVSAEGGKFSLTVPAGVEVLLNEGEFITDDGARAANFSVSAGVRIGFTFKHSGGSTGDITVTVGEPVEEILPTVTTDGTTNVTLPVKSGTTGDFVGAVGLAEVGAIESGKYELTVKMALTFRGCDIAFAKGKEEATYFDFFNNDGSVRTDEESATEAYVNTGDYSTATVEGVNYTVAGDVRTITWTITLDLAEGDVLVFANGGTSKGDVTLSLKKVTE